MRQLELKSQQGSLTPIYTMTANTTKKTRRHARKSSSKPRTRSTNASSDTRHSLLLAAQKQFAAEGFKASSVHEIAKNAGVNVSLVSYHFGNKEGLFKACLVNAGRDRLTVAERILSQSPTSLEDMKVRLNVFIDEILLDNINNPEICTILQRDLLSEFNFIEEEFRNTFLKMFQVLVNFFKVAQTNKIISPQVHPHSLSMFLMGAITHVVRTDHIRQKIFGESINLENHRREVSAQLLQLFFDGMSNRQSTSQKKGSK
jgi:TetR/AcrR family transcriptional regulator